MAEITPEMTAVGLTAFVRIAKYWNLDDHEAALLGGLSGSDWELIRTSIYDGDLTRDQLFRMSAVVGIYKALEEYFSEPLSKTWITRENTGPLFAGRRPIDVMIDGELDAILRVRHYLDDLCDPHA